MNKREAYPDGMRAALTALAFLWTASAAHSLDLPIYDVEGQCRAAYSGMGLASCIREDQAGYDFARAFWVDLPESSQRKCADMRKPPQMKYVQMQACVQAELQIIQSQRDAASPPRFRY